jgi:hypothetical protein
MAMAAHIFTATEPPEHYAAAIGGAWLAGFEQLIEHLTDRGRAQFVGEVLLNTRPGTGPGSLRWTLEKWWRSIAMLHDPTIQAALQRPVPSPGERGHQSTAELRAEVAEMLSGR